MQEVLVFQQQMIRFPNNKQIIDEQDFPLACVTQSRRQIIAKRQVIVAEVDSKQIGNGGQASIQHASNASSNGGSRSAKVTERVGKEWRMRQRFEGRMEKKGADSVGKSGQGGIAGSRFVLMASV